MVQEHKRRRYLSTIIFCGVLIGQTSVTVCATDFTYFDCHGDICNVEETEQFCSEKFQHCRSCSEVVDDCFTTKLPVNCSSTCIKYEVERRLAKRRDTTCKRLPFIRNGVWSNESDVFELGRTISAICLDRFTLVGSGLWNCTESGWVSLEDENGMPSCNDNIWFLAFVSVSAVLGAVLIGVAIYGVAVKCCNRHYNEDKSKHANSEDTEEAKKLLDEDKREVQSNRVCAACKENKIERKPDLLDRTISLEGERKTRKKVTPNNVEEEVNKETESRTGRTEASLNAGTPDVNVNVIVNNNPSNNIGNVNTSFSSAPDNVRRKDAATKPADTPEARDTMPDIGDLKLSQEESATFDQRQPLDGHPRPEIGDLGTSSTYPVTLNPPSNQNASAEARRGQPNDVNRNLSGAENGTNVAMNQALTKMAIGRDNFVLEDLSGPSGAREKKRDVEETGIMEQRVTGQELGKVAVGRDNMPQGDIDGNYRRQDNQCDVFENGKQEVTKQVVGKVAVGNNDIQLGGIAGTQRTVNSDIPAGIHQIDVAGRDVGKMTVGRGDIGLEDTNRMFGRANGHTAAVPALDIVITDQISRL